MSADHVQTTLKVCIASIAMHAFKGTAHTFQRKSSAGVVLSRRRSHHSRYSSRQRWHSSVELTKQGWCSSGEHKSRLVDETDFGEEKICKLLWLQKKKEKETSSPMGLQVVNLMQRWKIQLCLLRFGEGHEQNKTAEQGAACAHGGRGCSWHSQVDKGYLILCSVLLKGLVVFDDKVRLEVESSLSG